MPRLKARPDDVVAWFRWTAPTADLATALTENAGLLRAAGPGVLRVRAREQVRFDLHTVHPAEPGEAAIPALERVAPAVLDRLALPGLEPMFGYDPGTGPFVLLRNAQDAVRPAFRVLLRPAVHAGPEFVLVGPSLPRPVHVALAVDVAGAAPGAAGRLVAPLARRLAGVEGLRPPAVTATLETERMLDGRVHVERLLGRTDGTVEPLLEAITAALPDGRWSRWTWTADGGEAFASWRAGAGPLTRVEVRVGRDVKLRPVTDPTAAA